MTIESYVGTLLDKSLGGATLQSGKAGLASGLCNSLSENYTEISKDLFGKIKMKHTLIVQLSGTQNWSYYSTFGQKKRVLYSENKTNVDFIFHLFPKMEIQYGK